MELLILNMVKKKSKKKIIKINSLFKKKIDLPKFNISPSEILKKHQVKLIISIKI